MPLFRWCHPCAHQAIERADTVRRNYDQTPISCLRDVAARLGSALDPAASESSRRAIEFFPVHAPRSGNDVFARALIRSSIREALAGPASGRNKPGGGSNLVVLPCESKRRATRTVIACFTNVWITDTLVSEPPPTICRP